MAYREPKTQIQQDFEAALASGVLPLYACYLGPNYALHRFSVSSEKAKFGDYDRDAPSAVGAWPDHVAGGVIDLATAEIWAQDALLRYWHSATGGEITEDNGNKLYSSVIFKSNSYADRSSVFGTRDVAVNDVVRVRWVESSSGQLELMETTVAGFEADVIPGTEHPSPHRVTGFGDTTQGATESPSALPPARLHTSYDVTSYDGLAAGYPLDTYTLKVTAVGYGTTSGGTLDGTTLYITSDGSDTPVTAVMGGANAPWVADSSSGTSSSSSTSGYYLVTVGTRGAYLHLSDNGSGALAVGNLWRVAISQNYAEVTVSDESQFDVNGPYTGDENTQYILTVTLGGELGVDDLVFGYRTNNGADTASTFTAAAADFTGASADYAVGTKGMVVTLFKNTQWCTGDVVTFDVEAESEGAIHTLILRDKIPVETGIQLDVELFVKETIEFPSDYYELTADEITILGGAMYTTDLLGTEEAFPVYDGEIYASYRELKTAEANQLGSIAEITDVESTLGPISTLNPLALACWYGLSESGGVPVYYIAVESDDLSGYSDALDVLTEHDEIYSLVATNNSATVKALLRAHVLERSNDTNNQWRIAWVSNDTLRTYGVYTKLASGADLMATVSEYSTGLYRKFTIPAALLITNGVRAGDKVRINYTPDGEGAYTYDEYTIDRVLKEDILLVTTSLPGPISVPMKIEIWRTRTKNEYATALAADAATYNTRRVYDVWADNPVQANGTSLNLIYVAAALAGQRSGVSPHAPLSNVSLASVQLDPLLQLSRTQMNTIASGGVWIVMKDYSGDVFTRHQVSSVTDPDEFTQREQSLTTNLDHISRDFYGDVQDLFGQGNISPEMISLIRQRLESKIGEIKNRSYPAKIGPQMLDASITSLKIDEVLRDTVLVEIDPDMPNPLNNLTIKFRVS